MDRTLRDHVFKRHEALKQKRNIMLEDWIDVSDYVLGTRGQFISASAREVDREVSSHSNSLYNETAMQAAHILAAGMMAGITSPARPWFKLGSGDSDLDDYGPVRHWLDLVQKILLRIFAKSNFYDSMQEFYLEMGAFGTEAMSIIENFDNVARFETYTVGSYCLGVNGERKVDTLFREYRTTVGAMVGEFGKDNVSQTVRNLYEKGTYEHGVTVIHAIEPNGTRRFDSPLSRDMPWRSVCFEKDGNASDGPLRESGMRDKPFVGGRWSVIGDDVYARSCPGLDSLGTNKSLQIEELDLAIAREKMHNPPLIGDARLEAGGADLIAGGITYIEALAQMGKAGLAPVYTVNPDVRGLLESIDTKERRLERFFYADLFLMLTQMDRAQITATEIAERKEEKMLMLGPVLERLNNEVLDPVIDRVFALAQRAGILPPPPEELQDKDLSVEYISVLAQAQRAVSTSGIESTVAFAGNLAAVWPEARHKIDPMQAIDEYAKAKGASPKILRDDEDANERATAEQQQAQMAQMAEMAGSAASTAKAASETEPTEDDLLGQIAGAVA